MAATPMVPDGLDAAQYATRRMRRIDERRRVKFATDQKRAQALYREDHPIKPLFCNGKHRLRPHGYLNGAPPEGIDCQKPLRVQCQDCDYVTVWSCGNHKESTCRPCSARYRRRVRALAVEGMKKKGGYFYFVTFTGKSDVHFMPSGDECPCGERGFDLARWNASHSRRWNHLRTTMRRRWPGLEFFRGIEPQKRGALHDHVMVWSPFEISVTQLRKLAITAGFGHEVYAPQIEPGSTRAAYYVSKYVTKACDSRGVVPWLGQVIDFETGEVTEGLVDARYRTWSQSRSWGTTMAAVRAESSVWAQVYADRQLEPVVAFLVAELGAEAVSAPDIPPPIAP